MSKINKPRARKSKKHYIRRILALIIVVLLVLSGTAVWLLPASISSATTSLPTPVSTSVSLPWPSYGEAAIGAAGYGVLDSHGSQVMLPTASVAKLITVLTVLKRDPLSIGQEGPIITLGSSDVASFQHYEAIDGSVVNVASGEQISEYQAIQAILLPSANNMADSLATWAYGSMPAYLTAANQLIASLGLKNTVAADDASGFLPNTKSTANDLILLGQAALGNSVVRQIVDQKQAVIPVAGQINNVNWLLGQDGIIGIKTGNTDQAGGVYVFAADDAIDSSNNVTVIGAIMGGPTLKQVLSDSVPLLDAAKTNFKNYTLVKSGEVVGYYHLPWTNQIIDAVAQKDITLPVWDGAIPKVQVTLDRITAPTDDGAVVGSVSVNQNGSTISSKITLSKAVSRPSWEWRLLRHRV